MTGHDIGSKLQEHGADVSWGIVSSPGRCSLEDEHGEAVVMYSIPVLDGDPLWQMRVVPDHPRVLPAVANMLAAYECVKRGDA